MSKACSYLSARLYFKTRAIRDINPPPRCWMYTLSHTSVENPIKIFWTRITSKIEWVLPWPKAHPSTNFHETQSPTFCEILLRDKQTNTRRQNHNLLAGGTCNYIYKLCIEYIEMLISSLLTKIHSKLYFQKVSNKTDMTVCFEPRDTSIIRVFTRTCDILWNCSFVYTEGQSWSLISRMSRDPY